MLTVSADTLLLLLLLPLAGKSFDCTNSIFYFTLLLLLVYRWTSDSVGCGIRFLVNVPKFVCYLNFLWFHVYYFFNGLSNVLFVTTGRDIHQHWIGRLYSEYFNKVCLRYLESVQSRSFRNIFDSTRSIQNLYFVSTRLIPVTLIFILALVLLALQT